MSNAEVSKNEVRKTEIWKTWEGRLVDGKFTLRRWLGVSANSAVFLTDLRPSQKAAIKLIPAEAKDAEKQLSHWRAAAQLSHPHLLRIFESGRCQMDGSTYLYLLMECADEDLSQILPHRALTPAEAADLLPPLLEALSYLHAKRMVHGRVKPSNVQAVGDQLKLSPDHIISSTDMNAAGGRRDVYDAPETAAGIVSPAGDMWSVGVTLVAALTQDVAFAAEISGRDPVAPEKIPEPFRGIVRECLHLDPKRRCTVADVQARLQPAARSVPAGPEAVATPQQRPKRGLVSAAIIAVAVIIGIVVVYSRGGRNTPPAPTAVDQLAQQASSPPAQSPAPQVEKPAASQSAKPAAPQAAPVSTSAAPAKQPAPQPPTTTTAGGIVRQVIPEVSRSARNTIKGKIRVVVRVEVDSSGKVTEATLTSAGPSRYFAGLALKAAQGWEFSPPSVNGQPAASIWMLRFHFGRAQTQVSPERINR